MGKDTIEFITYEEVVAAIKTIGKYCSEQLACLLCPLREWCKTCTNEQPLDWRI